MTNQATSQEATPATLAAAIDTAWATHADALVEDGNRQRLTLYPSDNPHEQITVHPTWGSTEIDNGTVRVAHQTKERVHDSVMLMRTAETGETGAFALASGDNPYTAEAVAADQTAYDRLVAALEAGSPQRSPTRTERFMGKVARLAGRSN